MKHPETPPLKVSIVESAGGLRLHAPSSARNGQAISDVLSTYAPAQGKALELASGTGEHVTRLASILPGITWQPSDIESDRRASIDSWAKDLPNVRPSINLDATAPGWADRHPGQNLILLVNLLHLISTPQARTVISEAARALAPKGRFFLYGPFLRDGVATSESDARFDASLRASDPGIGYKDAGIVRRWLAEAGLDPVASVDMPANNLTLITERRAETP